ncbi:LysR family transcriptional regulator [Methylobacterium sp. E-045]|uniref:LysR family transcriptional regulator n=1 Tax=Methylobacterium sp. E-045 TaxID=2836575 RepID=UPI001FBA2B1E|nr:LysR family transcriptional regulator [Methylobacterium sp. E-045]MCJ2129708.1 LysR family transcriptional regulator [Methylobacterium sp. E-045]
MDLTVALRAFIRTVERGSMTAAAQDLGISQPAVSKLLRNLETHARARLLERNSRAVRPSPTGLRLYEACNGALATIDAAIDEARNEAGTIEGTLRLHGPICLGESRLHRIVADFQHRHPAVSVRLTLENRSADLVHEGFDLAICMGRPVDQDAILRRIGLVRRILVAAPSYLEKRASVTEPRDLLDHSLLVTDTVLSRADTLPLCRNGETMEIPVCPVLTTNNARVLIDALLSGRGIGTAQVQLVAEDLASGRLVRVLGDHEIRPTELYVTYSSARFLRPTVRAFVDFVIPALRRIDGIV